MTYELFQQGPSVYIPLILSSLVFTLIAYGAFPLLFAACKSKPVTRRKYNWACYGINFIVMFAFIILNGESSGGPYVIWTLAFSSLGLRILKKRGLLVNGQAENSVKGNLTADQSKPAAPSADGVTLPAENTIQHKILFCRKCGFRLLEGSAFCSNCGAPIDKGA